MCGWVGEWVGGEDEGERGDVLTTCAMERPPVLLKGEGAPDWPPPPPVRERERWMLFFLGGGREGGWVGLGWVRGGWEALLYRRVGDEGISIVDDLYGRIKGSATRCWASFLLRCCPCGCRVCVYGWVGGWVGGRTTLSKLDRCFGGEMRTWIGQAMGNK